VFRSALGPLGIGVFVALMLVATAIARTAAPTIAIRFLDHVMLAGFISIAAAFILVAQNRRWLPWVALWGLVLGFGYLATVGATLSQMVNRRQPQVGLEILQHYYATNDPAVMRENDAFKLFIVGDDPTEFIGQLQDPGLRAVLPRAITAPGTGRGLAASVASAVARWGLAIAFVAACGAILTILRCQPKRFVSAVMLPATSA
jgi:hypothetical protein